MTDKKILTVSQINEYIKYTLDQDELLSFVCIRGEISNYKVYPSGHHYFSLKDAGGTLRCVMFKGSACRLRFRPENGMKVLAYGRVSVFPRDGAYQLYCEQLSVEGAGDLFAAFEQLKAQLQQEGVFLPENKKKLPAFPKRIAIITSSAGAAVHDMLRIIEKRYPLAWVYILPVRVQGVEAPAEICGAIEYANRFELADVIITGRGGGSMEDLWAFNSKELAYAIFRSKIPVISAVGHEPDVTISDYVADVRAATPSNAAEIVVPDQAELRERLASLQVRMQQAVGKKSKLLRQRLQMLSSGRCLRTPEAVLQERRLQVDYQHKQLLASAQQAVSVYRQNFIHLAASLDAMSPLKVLARGYGVVKRDERVLTCCDEISCGDTVTVRLHKGTFDATVTRVEGE